MADQSNRPDHTQKTRRPYEAPRIEETAEFETLALSCAKEPPPIGSEECAAGGPEAS